MLWLILDLNKGRLLVKKVTLDCAEVYKKRATSSFFTKFHKTMIL